MQYSETKGKNRSLGTPREYIELKYRGGILTFAKKLKAKAKISELVVYLNVRILNTVSSSEQFQVLCIYKNVFSMKVQK